MSRWKGIMKCYPFEEKRLLKWNPPYIVQPKYDGVRCRAVAIDNGYVLLSSEENVISSVPHINNTLDKICLGYELDGELYYHGMSFEQIVSITSRTVNLHPNYKQIKFHLFDVISEKPQYERLMLVTSHKNLDDNLEVAPYFLCNNLGEVIKAYDTFVNQKYEGIIVRNFESFYERKRSTNIMKFKPKQSDIYKIVQTVEEISINGIPKGTLGSLLCESGDGDTFNVGTGFTEAQRRHLWSIRSILPGIYVKIKYQHLTPGRKVPRFPVFVEIP